MLQGLQSNVTLSFYTCYNYLNINVVSQAYRQMSINLKIEIYCLFINCVLFQCNICIYFFTELYVKLNGQIPDLKKKEEKREKGGKETLRRLCTSRPHCLPFSLLTCLRSVQHFEARIFSIRDKFLEERVLLCETE